MSKGKLLSLAASLLLLGAGLAPAPAQELFPLQAVASGGGCGGLSGSMLPCAFGNWVNDLDEHFTDPTTSVFTPSPDGDTNIGGTDDCSAAGVVTWNAPGGGILLKATNDVTNGGCSMYSTLFSTPGYFEWKNHPDEGGPIWQGAWLGVGITQPPYSTSTCGFDKGSTEIDYPDECCGTGPTPQPETQPKFFFTNNYQSPSCPQGDFLGSASYWGDAEHVYGIDYGDGNALTFYIDGTQVFQKTAADTSSSAMEPGTCPAGSGPYCVDGNWTSSIWFMDFYFNGSTVTPTTGMNTRWVRHYHH